MKCPKCGCENPDNARKCQWAFCNHVFSRDPGAEETPLADLLLRSVPRADVTSALAAACALAYAVLTVAGGSFTGPSPVILLKFGGNFPPATVTGEWWRLLTALFLHASPVHLVVNIWLLWNIGQVTERLYGPWPFLGIFLAAGLFGNILGIYLNPWSVGVGASGAVLGLAGAMLAFFAARRMRIAPAAYREIYVSLSVFLAWSVFSGLTQPQVNNTAHVAGLVAGFCCGLFLTRPLPGNRLPPRPRVIRVASIAAFLLVCSAIGTRIHFKSIPYALSLGSQRSFESLVQYAEGVRQAEKGRSDEALACFRAAVETDPDNPLASNGLGAALLDRGRLAEALPHLERAFEKDPGSGAFRLAYARGLLLGGRSDEALAHLEQIVDAHEDDPAKETPHLVLSALDLEVLALANLKRYRDGLRLADDILEVYARANALPMRRLKAQVMLARAATLFEMRRTEAALEYCRAVRDRHQGEGDDHIRTVMARVLLLESGELLRAFRYRDSLAASEAVLREYAESTAVDRRAALAQAKINKGLALLGVKRAEEGREELDEVRRRHAEAGEPQLRELGEQAARLLKKIPPPKGKQP